MSSDHRTDCEPNRVGHEVPSKSWQIEVRCAPYLLHNHERLKRALDHKDSSHYLYYIQAGESKDGSLQLTLEMEQLPNVNVYPPTPPSSSSQHNEVILELPPIEEVITEEPNSQSHDNIVVTEAPSDRDPVQPSHDSVAANIPSDVMPSNVSSGQLTTTEIHKSSGTTTIFTNLEKAVTEEGDSREQVAHKGTVLPKPTSVMIHSVYHYLHGLPCVYYSSHEECLENYSEQFGYSFYQYMTGFAYFADANIALYKQCIKYHLKSRNCPSSDGCPELWKFCLDSKMYGVLKHGSEGLLIHSKHQKHKIGTICKEYFNYGKCIGSGGCGEVHKFTLNNTELALKIEKKRPMIHNVKVFEQMIELNSKHVTKMLEYVVGPRCENDHQLFLFIMPYMNKRGLHLQFQDELNCVLDYMAKFLDEKNIFRNYVVLFLHLLRGLQYLQGHGIVHRDIKVSNILVHQNCNCPSPLLCTCDGDGGVQYVLGDVNLMCIEDGESCTVGEWAKMIQHAPAGTRGLIAPELFFKTNEGERFSSHKSDVYSACATMMEVLVGKDDNATSRKQISEFFEAITTSIQTLISNIQKASQILDKTLTKAQKTSEVFKLKQLLHESQQYVQQVQSFQGSFTEIYTEKSPLAGILTTVYGANSLHWVCLKKLPEIYNKPIWTELKAVIEVITEGVKFMPKNRPDAVTLIRSLEKLHPPSKTHREMSDDGYENEYELQVQREED